MAKLITFSMKYAMRTKKVTKLTEQRAAGRLYEAGLKTERKAKELCNKGIGQKGEAGRDSAGRFTAAPVIKQASKPGEPPRKRTGNLQNSIKTEVLTMVQVLVGPTVYYGKFLEFGTRKMAARPFMRPALKETQKSFSKLFRRLW
jgi:HK97 gp10 family phage protein